MGLPIPADIVKMDYAFEAQPAVFVPAKGEIATQTMNYAFEGQPFVTVPGVVITNVAIEELIVGLDETKTTIIYKLEELINALDEITTLPVVVEELGVLLDETKVTVILSIEELITAIDEIETDSFAQTGSEELGTLLDETVVRIIVKIEELITGTDETNPFEFFNEVDGIKIEIADTEENLDGIKLVIADFNEADSQDLSGINIAIGENNLVLTTNASAEDNPFQATVAVNGNTLIAHNVTNPGSTALENTSVYIHWLGTGLEGNKWTDLWNFNFELDYAGGHFAITSKKPLKTVTTETSIDFSNAYHWPPDQGAYIQVSSLDPLALANLGKQVNIFGFTGTILDFGPTISDQQAGFVHQGFFGAPLMHRSFNLVTYSSPLGQSIGTNERPLPAANYSAALEAANYQDLQSAALTVADVVGVKLNWFVQNAPLENTFKIDGLTAMGAISSLAAQVGATLRWNGSDTYSVCYPNQSFGLWEVPHPKLLTSAGLSYLQHYDLETGALGNRLILIPRQPVTDPSSRTIASEKDQGGLPTLQKIVSGMRQKLTDEDPPLIFDLPYNYDKVYIQILVSETGDTGGGNQVDLPNFITRDPTEWFEFSPSTLIGTSVGGITGYIFNTFIGNSYVPQVKLDHRVFPVDGANATIDNGNFALSLACSTKSLNELYDKAKQQQENNLRENLSAGFDAVRYIKTYSGTITCQFFGSIPVPGMWGRAVIPGGAKVYTRNLDGSLEECRVPLEGDMIVQGVIESVQFSFPGTITVQVAQYAKIDFGSGIMSQISIQSFEV